MRSKPRPQPHFRRENTPKPPRSCGASTSPTPALVPVQRGPSVSKGDKPREAKAAYEQFLTVAPQHKLAPEVSGYIRDMDTILSTQKKAQEISLELDKEKAEDVRSPSAAARTQHTHLQEAAVLGDGCRRRGDCRDGWADRVWNPGPGLQ